MRNTYAQRRLVMIDKLKAMGFGIAKEPEGAFYIFANAKSFRMTPTNSHLICLKKRM
jgi:aspartate/methionine/tyrosine aminotransferase